MPYEITISGIDTTFSKCIGWVSCKVDTPSTSNARTNFVGNYMNISGFIGTDEVTIDLYNWAMLPVNDKNVFRNVQLTVKDANDNVIEKVSFPNAFVEFYSESYTRDKGLGKFNLQLKQKIDKNGDVGVSDSSTDEKVKSAAGSKIPESVLGNTPKSDILDTGEGNVNGFGKSNSKLVEYGSTDLSKMVTEYRIQNNVRGTRNIAVLEYEKDGVLSQEIAESSRDSGLHSEEILDQRMTDMGIEPSQVKRIYTERQPCSLEPYHNCDNLIYEKYQNAEVTHSFEYGNAASRKAGNEAMKKAIDKLFK